jgi:hypothetical protein
MTTTKNLTTALVLALGALATGCAADSPDDDGGGGGGGGGGDPVPQDLDPTGKYTMRSTYDLATNAPGKVGDVVNALIAATDDPDDPTAWVLEQAIAQMPSGTFKNLAQSAAPFIAGYLNDRVLELAPDLFDTMVQLGNDFGQMSKNFGLNETLEVAGNTGTHTVLGAHFKIDNVESDHMFADFGVENVAVPGVAVMLDKTGKFTIADHKVALSYGKVLRVGLDGAIIPMLDPTATNLGQLLQNKVDCQAVGVAIRDAIASQFGFGGSASTYESACNAGLVAGANFIYSKINDIDGSALELGIAGTAKGLDKDGDRKVDTIQTGAWTGTASYAGSPAPLANATFYGSRM